MKYSDEIKTKKKQKRKLRAFLVILFIVAILAGIIYILFFVKLFYITSISVHATPGISKPEVESKIWEMLDGKFLGLAGNMNEDLMQAFPRIATVQIHRTSLHELDIKITERQPVGIWCTDACFYFDGDGIAFSQIASTSGFLFIGVDDRRDRSLSLGKEVAPGDWRLNIMEIRRIMQFGNLRIASIEIPEDSHGDFTVNISEGWSVLYNNDTNVGEQTNVLLTLLKEKITSQARARLEYVDLRLEDRIYYKVKE